MAWSIFTDGGGDGAAATWAADLLHEIGAPATPANMQFVYDWEKSEGGGGAYNPLNEGPDPGHPELTTTGSQYGGGAADYAGWQAGLRGAADYLAMGNFTGIRDALRRGDAAGARSALIASPWAASHYGYGNAFSNASLPGTRSALPPYTGQAGGGGGGGVHLPWWLGGGTFDPFGGLVNTLDRWLITGPLVLAGAALVVFGAVKATGVRAKVEQGADRAAGVAAVAA